MPPQISEDERSSSAGSDTEDVAPVPGAKMVGSSKKTAKALSKNETPVMKVSEEPEQRIKDEDEGVNNEESGEDEYVVEKILEHVIDEDGIILFRIKWKGFEKKSDQTWEGEENLAELKLLDDYYESVGGKEALFADYEEKKNEAITKKGKKRGRSSIAADSPAGAKKAKNGTSTPPASKKIADFKPPTGSWEEDVVSIDATEGTKGEIVVFLTWKGGHKTQHPSAQVYKRCPQRMLKFYESHLVFKKSHEVE